MSWRYKPVYISSFSAPPSPQEEQAARRALQRLGVSPPGVDQFLNGQVVVNPADRARLAGIFDDPFFFDVNATARLASRAAPPGAVAQDSPPAVSRGFQGGCANVSDLLRLGVSPPGVTQFLNGQVVANPADRARLAGLIVLGFTPPIGSNKGSLADRIPSGGLFPGS